MIFLCNSDEIFECGAPTYFSPLKPVGFIAECKNTYAAL